MTDADARIRHASCVTPAKEVPVMTQSTHSRRPTPEERRFLELLCLWRGLYAGRGAQDRAGAHSLADVVRDAERRMRALRLHDDELMRRFTGRPR